MSGTPYPSIRRANLFSFKVLVYSLFVLQIYSPTEALSFPRFVTKSFRFPSDHSSSELYVDPLRAFMGNVDNFSGRRPQDIVPYGEARKASIPVSASLPSSPSAQSEIKGKEMDSYEDGSSAEIIESDGPISSGSSSAERNTTLLEEEVLRNLLCPSINTSHDSHPGLNRPIIPADNATSLVSSSSGSQADSPSQLLRYNLQTGKCGQVGKRAHCGENMILVADIDSGAYGYCECDFENKIEKREGKIGTSPTTGLTRPLLMMMNTPLVYHPATKSCYPLYEQAYCKKNEWLVLSREVKGPACEERKCPLSSSRQTSPTSSSDNPTSMPKNRRRTSKLLTPHLWTERSTEAASFSINKRSGGNALPESPDNSNTNSNNNLWVPLNGDGPCVQLDKENTMYCEDGEKVLFRVGDIVPKCGVPGREIEGRAIIRNACPPGSFYSIIGRCQPSWDF